MDIEYSRRLIGRICVLKDRLLSTVDDVFEICGKFITGKRNLWFFHLVQLCVEYHRHASFVSVIIFGKNSRKTISLL